MKELEALLSDAIDDLTCSISVPEAIVAILRKTPEVAAAKAAFAAGAVTEEDIARFVRLAVAEFRPGARLEGDGTLCALAVALEDDATDVAEEFLRELSEIRVQEMPLAPRVARLCLAARQSMSRNIEREDKVDQLHDLRALIARGELVVRDDAEDGQIAAATNVEEVHLLAA